MVAVKQTKKFWKCLKKSLFSQFMAPGIHVNLSSKDIFSSLLWNTEKHLGFDLIV